MVSTEVGLVSSTLWASDRQLSSHILSCFVHLGLWKKLDLNKRFIESVCNVHKVGIDCYLSPIDYWETDLKM